MKEFKFLALVYPLKRLLIFAIPIWIIFIALFLTVNIFEYFGYFFVVAFILNASFLFFFFKYVNISFSSSDEIHICFNGKEQYVGNAQSLEYVKGVNLVDSSASGPLKIAFSDKCFTFNILENNGLLASRTTRHQSLLRYMVTVYGLEKGSSESTFLRESFIYLHRSEK